MTTRCVCYCENVGNTTAAAAATAATNNPALILFHRYARFREVILGTQNVWTPHAHRHTCVHNAHKRGYTSRADRLRTHSPARDTHRRRFCSAYVYRDTVIRWWSVGVRPQRVVIVPVHGHSRSLLISSFFFLDTVVPGVVRAGRIFPL